MKTPYRELAKILRTKKSTLRQLDKRMSTLTKTEGVLNSLVEENNRRQTSALVGLKGGRNNQANKVWQFLIDKLKRDDQALYKLFGRPSGTTDEGLQILFKFARELADIKPLYVLKKAKAEEILRKNPPPHILKSLGYKNIDELLKHEDMIEIFCALRFVESGEWMHKTFDKTYPSLTAKDFERRPVELRVLSGKWLKVAEKFVQKKYHNVSHLKELGVIFVIPLKIDTGGETLRLFSLILHYLHEVDFYSKLFVQDAKKRDFGKRLISLLKGEILAQVKHQKGKANWLIIQRYLAKIKATDKRLARPHINPEALHWQKAEENIARLGREYKEIDLEFWLKLDWVGGFFKNNHGRELISFDLVDSVMSLVKNKEQVKYLYHQQEALWNEIFARYMGSANLEKLMIKNFNKGEISL